MELVLSFTDMLYRQDPCSPLCDGGAFCTPAAVCLCDTPHAGALSACAWAYLGGGEAKHSPSGR